MVESAGSAGRAGAGRTGDDTHCQAVEVLRQEWPGTHILGFFLDPDHPFGAGVFGDKGFQLINGQGIELFEAQDGCIVEDFVVMFLQQFG